jgi:hypothetical protein
MQEDVEGSGHGLILGTVIPSACRDWGKAQKPSSVSQLRFEPNISKAQIRRITVLVKMVDDHMLMVWRNKLFNCPVTRYWEIVFQ